MLKFFLRIAFFKKCFFSELVVNYCTVPLSALTDIRNENCVCVCFFLGGGGVASSSPFA